MSTPLDRPIWSALTTWHAEFADGGPLALRYAADIEPFACARDDDPESLAALASLAEPGEALLLLQSTPSPLPPGFQLLSQKAGVQMIAERPIAGALPDDALALGDADSSDMIALAELTRPGPFRARTHRLGRFWGIRRDGRLIAMAGERMRLPGMTELSGVCVHPDWRGHGLARALSAFVASEIQQRGETPFLHAYADNDAAVTLYGQLGFVIRAPMTVQLIAPNA